MVSKSSFIVVSLLLASACSDDNQFRVTDLVSDQPGLARVTDPALVNPWGIQVGDDGVVWVANNGTGAITNYDRNGNIIDAAVSTGAPLTGAALNPTGAFPISDAAGATPAEFIFAALNGDLIGFSGQLRTLSTVAFSAAPNSAVFTGVAVSPVSDTDIRLFAANFTGKQVVTFDANFVPLGTMGDPDVPPEFGPFNVIRVGDRIYVTYAVVGDNGEEVVGPGLGFVSSFFLDGTFDRRIATGGTLNAPWGVARAPNSFSGFGNDLLIGNFGDGIISAFNDNFSTQTINTTGSGNVSLDGVLEDQDGNTIVTDGLWGLAVNGQDLFFAAGIDDETHGLFGRINVN